MLKKVLIAVVVIIGALCAFVATRPGEFKIERSASMKAPADIVFGVVNDFHRWDGWSPWAKLDPNMKVTHEGAAAGQGAIYSWAGNDQVGEGRMTITTSKPNELVQIKLEFLKPWQATNDTKFKFEPAGDQTKVTWTMDGHNDFMGKAFGVFMDMDKMVGKDFEKGLAQMKSVTESEAEKRAAEAKVAAEAAPAPAAAEQPAAPAPVEGEKKQN